MSSRLLINLTSL